LIGPNKYSGNGRHDTISRCIRKNFRFSLVVVFLYECLHFGEAFILLLFHFSPEGNDVVVSDCILDVIIFDAID
jgi:hypothetical protein